MFEPSTLQAGQEQYEKFKSRSNKKNYIAYDYRHTDGELFSCVKPTLELCRMAKDEWLPKKVKCPYRRGNFDKGQRVRYTHKSQSQYIVPHSQKQYKILGGYLLWECQFKRYGIILH